MEVRAALRQLRAAADLPRLLAALGHHLESHALSPGTLPLPARDAVVAGGGGCLEWVGLTTRPALANARHLSHSLRQQGRLAAVLALDVEARQLAVAITVERTIGWCVSLDTPSASDLERLRRIGAPLALARTPLGGALVLRDALAAEDVGRRFFQAFRAVAERMASGLTPTPPPGARDTLALVQLTRVLFLYFVQAKGWLDGRRDFLRDAVDDGLASGRRLHRDLFRPLFFGTLNRPAEARRRARRFGRVPFLNGGLFEPHPLERAWRGEVPDDCWREAFDALFERFHFALHEGGEANAIAPDMLGRVFEGLMAGDERHASGAFFTPAPLVRRLVESALTGLVSRRLRCDPGVAQRLLAQRDPSLGPLLREVRILDPAAGSGAFLLGALERLAELRHHEAPAAELRRRILAHNLYGVDLHPMAVRLTELRLWLAVIAAEPAGPGVPVAPLPNLDGIVRQGDTLLDPAALLARLGARPARSGTALRRLREAFLEESGAGKRDLLRRLRQAEVRALEECLQQAAHRLEGEVTECLLAARAPTLFGERRGLDRPLRTRLRMLRADLARVRQLHRRLIREGEVPWFSHEIHFGDVLAQGGFDLVLGNPPWVRAEDLPPATRRALGERYRWWRSSGTGFTHLPDLSVAFVERGLELLAPGGVLAYLLPAKLATAGYGRALRRALAESATIHTLADLTHDPVAAFDATTYPLALVVARHPPPGDHLVHLTLEPAPGSRWPQSRLARSEAWVIAQPALLEALIAVHGSHPRLDERFTPQLGVKTGANDVFLDPPPAIEAALIRSALRGRDIRPFRHRAGIPLLFAHDAAGRPYPRLPEMAARFLRPHEAVLRARVDYEGGPPWTLFRVRPALSRWRLAWPDLARALTVAPLITAGVIPLSSCYLLVLPDRATMLALSAWLNSTWLRVAARAAADVAASGFARFNARVVGALPMPPAVLTDTRLIALAERGTGGERVQEEIDAVAAEHLGLALATRELLVHAPGSRTTPDG